MRVGGVKHGEDLREGAALPAQGKNVSFEFRTGPAGLPLWNRGAVLKMGREAILLCPLKPPAHRSFTDMIGGGDNSEGKVLRGKKGDHFSSHPGGESGMSVHGVRAGFWAVACLSTTSLPEPFRADNVLKHDS